MFESIKNFMNKSDDRHSELRKLDAEADQFKLPSETLPQLLKFMFFAGLAVLNYRLFARSVPGVWGQATGVVACMAEALALYCSHYFSRAAGLFRIALGLCGGVLMLFSLIHGTFSIFDLMRLSSFSATIHWYSHVVAFPLLAALIGLSVIALTMTHPHNVVRLHEALAHTQIARSRAEAASDSRLMRTRSVIEDVRLAHRQERTQRESQYLQTLKQYIGIEAQKRQLVLSIPDPRLRAELAQELGIDIQEQEPPKKTPGFIQGQSKGSVLD
jgi:hypothetical protein